VVERNPDEFDRIFKSQAYALQTGVNAFVPPLEALHLAFTKEQFSDWPTVLLATLLQTTAVSLFKLLPPAVPVNEPVDRRSIATLIRNLVDTHDALDLLCNTITQEEFNLHRDILGYYLLRIVKRACVSSRRLVMISRRLVVITSEKLLTPCKS
jgi:hypothetical protein